MLFAQAVFLLECRQTYRQMRLNTLPHASGYRIGMGNESQMIAVLTDEYCIYAG